MSSRNETSYLAEMVDRIVTWLEHEPNPGFMRWRNLIACSVITVVCAYALAHTSLFSFRQTGLGPDDLSLAGTWKYKIADRADFSNPKLDDSDWCLISVPDAGENPVPSPGDHPDAACPPDIYPAAKFRNNIYWYRRTFNVPTYLKWRDPSLFVGAVKDRAWYFFDGHLIGSSFLNSHPQIFLLTQDLLTPGTHNLSIRIQTGNSENPGVFHAYERSVSIGELEQQENAIQTADRESQERAIVAVVQFLALSMILLLVFRSRESTENFLWLAIYFGAVSFRSSLLVAPGGAKIMMNGLEDILMSTAIVGYGHHVFFRKQPRIRAVNRLIVTFGFASTFIKLSWPNLPIDLAALELSSTYAFGVLIYVVYSGIQELTNRRESFLSISDLITGTTLIVLHIIYFCVDILFAGHAKFVHLPMLTTMLTVAMLIVSTEDYMSKTRLLVFLGRFVRPGLRQLIWDFRKQPEKMASWVRGRKIPILKIDIVGYTGATYRMPYGVKRLHQDLWYNYIDSILEGIAFFNVPEGDGSIYCINEKLDKPCTQLVQVADQICDRVIPEFDRNFRAKLTALVDKTPELKMPLDYFERRHKRYTGSDFWAKPTQVRLIFHYGWVDEGLWGLKSQSHYNIAGDLLIEISRLEKQANADEYLFTQAFLEKWIAESPGADKNLELNWRISNLRGVGDFKYAILRKSRINSLRSAAQRD